ncbi:MAG: cation:proton antiporter [Spirulinaceae cyanobacterium RM2_2_10]|nr:cation:proton antiporter [Spirulinaceae cyanobacterium SM2_1_0]NJO19012.1 cation:proton antiporter [Spirulinaceae cyanobacterium RM2_2_10]
MTFYLNLALRLGIWFLLTADLSWANIIIGVSVVLFLPYASTSSASLRDWLSALWKILKAIPQAYIEAWEIMLRPHDQEVITMERVPPRRTPGLVFLDIFLITFTPKTIVLKYHERGWYEVHKIQRGEG